MSCGLSFGPHPNNRVTHVVQFVFGPWWRDSQWCWTITPDLRLSRQWFTMGVSCGFRVETISYFQTNPIYSMSVENLGSGSRPSCCMWKKSTCYVQATKLSIISHVMVSNWRLPWPDTTRKTWMECFGADRLSWLKNREKSVNFTLNSLNPSILARNQSIYKSFLIILGQKPRSSSFLW